MYKAAPKALGAENRNAGVGAGRQEWQFTRTVKATVQEHRAQGYAPEKQRPEKKVPSESQTPKCRSLRQPAIWDDRFEDEVRYVTLGLLREQVVVIVHTESDDVIRVISMRKASKYEEAAYFEQVAD